MKFIALVCEREIFYDNAIVVSLTFNYNQILLGWKTFSHKNSNSFARFSQNFIDIREKERKRGARGLVTVPKTVELVGNETSADNATVISTTTLSPEEQSKAEEMLKLQQKISQEILNSNLKENEMNELQVK